MPQLERPRLPLSPSDPALTDWLWQELTYTSCAIEGNPLTREEIGAFLRSQGLDLNPAKLPYFYGEAYYHHQAARWAWHRATMPAPMTPDDILTLQQHVLGDLHTWLTPPAPDLGGKWRTGEVMVGSNKVPYTASKVPGLMDAFGAWLATATPTVETACRAHLRLLDIHPFGDGNGRTARLLMNVILLQGGYAPIIVPPQVAPAYHAAIKHFVANGDDAAFMAVMAACALDTYDVLHQSVPNYPRAAAMNNDRPAPG